MCWRAACSGFIRLCLFTFGRATTGIMIMDNSVFVYYDAGKRFKPAFTQVDIFLFLLPELLFLWSIVWLN